LRSKFAKKSFSNPFRQFFDLLGKAERLRAGAEANPFIDPQGYRQFVAQMPKQFEEKLKAERAGKK
jgi:hypothetical protein